MAEILLTSSRFNLWNFELSVDEDLPERSINYACDDHGFSMTCDSDERIQVFLTSDSFHPDFFDIPFSSSRSKMLSIFGEPSRSGKAHHDPILGEYGAWDRYDWVRYSMHIEYQPHADTIRRITLMRVDVVP
jgi:hypothetical protein